MTNAHTDGEALIPLDRELFRPATDSTSQDDTQIPESQGDIQTPDTPSSAPSSPGRGAGGSPW